MKIFEFIRVPTVIIGLMVLLSVVNIIRYSLDTPESVRDVYFEEPTTSLGELQANEEATFELKLVNSTKSTIQLGEVVRSCSCLEVSVGLDSVDPGGSCLVKGKIATGANLGRLVGTIAVKWSSVLEEKNRPAVARLVCDVVP